MGIFEDIPITFSDACLALRVHPTDEALKTHVRDLFLTLRKEIPELRTILLRKYQESLPRHLFKQHPEGEATAITASLESIDRAARRVTSRVNALESEISVQTLRQIFSVDDAVSKSRVNLERLSDELRSLRLAQIEAEARSARRHDQVERNLHTFVESIRQAVGRQLKDCQSQFRQGFSGIQDKLLEHMKRDNDPPAAIPALPVPGAYYVQAPTVYVLATSPTSILLSFDECYTLLGIRDSLFLTKDLGKILRSSRALPKNALKRATWLLNLDRFKTWADISRRSSDLILVNSHLNVLIIGKISSLSVFAATLASMPRISPNLVLISHYCGLHTSPRDVMAGPKGMLRSLIAQLILLRRHDQVRTTISLDESLVNDIAIQDLRGLCEILRSLLSQFPQETTIFGALDNISEFKTSLYGWELDMGEIIRCLRFIVGQMRWGPKLKEFLTAANRSITIYRQIDEADCISLSAGRINSHSAERRSLESEWQQALSPG
ncbi:Fc.00g094270.m01.CDS01 [Cosmosporella sp. VM-42]